LKSFGGLRLEGAWMHVGTPEAVAAAESAVVASAPQGGRDVEQREAATMGGLDLCKVTVPSAVASGAAGYFPTTLLTEPSTMNE
jgi:hypothetical protein